MSQRGTERILDAAYVCFTRHGARRTTMEDIAREAGMSRAAVYQYVRNKEDALRRLVARLFEEALTRARQEAAKDGSLEQRLEGVLLTKLELTLRIWRDSPHATELLGAGVKLSADLQSDYTIAVRSLLADTIRAERPDANADELADVLLAFTRGLEADPDNPSDPRQPQRLLHSGVVLTVAGLTAGSPAPEPTRSANSTRPARRAEELS